MNRIIKKIISTKSACYFISPHFDDAILSCGSLMHELSGKVPLTVINVFTAAHKGPYTISAKQFLKLSGFRNQGLELFATRAEEDRKALYWVHARIINLGLTADQFRLKPTPHFLGKIFPELNHIYPTYRWHVLGRISKSDNAEKILTTKLRNFQNPRAVFFIPMGIGGHVDHRIVRQVAQKLFSHLVLYSDFPYNVRCHNYGCEELPWRRVELDFSSMNKKLIGMYKTQIKGLFPQGKIPDHKEVYFHKDI